MKKTLLLFVLLSFAIGNVLAQFSLKNGNASLTLHDSGDVVLGGRGVSGRLLAVYSSKLLTINYNNDFSGGTQIGTQALFKGHGLTIGKNVSPTSIGEVKRLSIIPYYHGGTWDITSRDNAQNAYLVFNYASNKNLLTIQHQGNMGLGVADPKSRLEVNGTIRAKEVKIEATGWADFVFADHYKLPTLCEVEEHIRTHKSLLNIPTEQEVLADGINVGEMQTKLLQKIEELTLYVIEQQKELNSLKEENKVIKNKLQDLNEKTK